MRLFSNKQFEDDYRKLSPENKQRIRKALGQLAENPRYPGLHVKKMHGQNDVWEARASRDLRITFEMAGEDVTLLDVGHHDILK